MKEKMWYECEVCGKMEYLTEEEAYNKGWDYPPFMGEWGVVSPRTCGDCPVTETAWLALVTHQKLTEKQLDTIKRIQNEI